MKVKKIIVKRGKKVNIGNYESENYELAMEVSLEEQDEPHDIISGVKNILDQKLLAWENSLKNDNNQLNFDSISEIKTAQDLIMDETDKITDSDDNKINFDDNKEFICPKCKEPMVKKEGKNYFLCDKHWGYPDMIERGEVREKQF